MEGCLTLVDLIMDPASFSAVDGSTFFFQGFFPQHLRVPKEEGGGELFGFCKRNFFHQQQVMISFFFVIFTPISGEVIQFDDHIFFNWVGSTTN